jgi:hypothetical protein
MRSVPPPAAAPKKEEEGRVHVVESNDKTVRLGVFDTTLEPILSEHMVAGVPIETLLSRRVPLGSPSE